MKALFQSVANRMGMGKHEVKKNPGNKGKGEVSGGEDVMENTLFEVVKENTALNV